MKSKMVGFADDMSLSVKGDTLVKVADVDFGTNELLDERSQTVDSTPQTKGIVGKQLKGGLANGGRCRRTLH